MVQQIHQRDSNGKLNGSLNRIAETLSNNNINNAVFHEPDWMMTTAVCFLANERVYDYEKYPITWGWNDVYGEILYSDWVNLIGGDKNVLLRELIKGKKIGNIVN